eukprot:m.367466 g.367466  ORF g.367466 m.367466 type:complete len:113 (-) comp40834_c0_seq1:614-952(-)
MKDKPSLVINPMLLPKLQALARRHYKREAVVVSRKATTLRAASCPMTCAALVLVVDAKRQENGYDRGMEAIAVSNASPLQRKVHTDRLWRELKQASRAAPDRYCWAAQAVQL